MPTLEQIANGDVKITNGMSMSYNGQVYRGRKAIMELAKQHATAPSTKSEVKKSDNDSAPAATPKDTN